ncbi:MAG: hypothetical protein J6W64_01320 [Bacilli bacterium]|nr:hypothetical protein [Bacilli bacterium]
MKTKRRFLSDKNINFLIVFLVLDLFLIFGLLRSSNAVYVSTAVADSSMDVALYAFRYDGLKEVNGTGANPTIIEQSLDVNVGELQPGDTKYYNFRVYNTDEDGTISDTNISYKLKIIVTTNIGLEYALYYNQNSTSPHASSLISGTNIEDTIITDGWGTYFRVFAIDEKCFKFNAAKYDEYTLKVTLPNTQEFMKSEYQDLIESIKIQLESKQVLPGDSADVNNICR